MEKRWTFSISHLTRKARCGKLKALQSLIFQAINAIVVLKATHTVHEMARDEARHGKAFAGLLQRYFG